MVGFGSKIRRPTPKMIWWMMFYVGIHIKKLEFLIQA